MLFEKLILSLYDGNTGLAMDGALTLFTDLNFDPFCILRGLKLALHIFKQKLAGSGPIDNSYFHYSGSSPVTSAGLCYFASFAILEHRSRCKESSKKYCSKKLLSLKYNSTIY